MPAGEDPCRFSFSRSQAYCFQQRNTALPIETFEIIQLPGASLSSLQAVRSSRTQSGLPMYISDYR